MTSLSKIASAMSRSAVDESGAGCTDAVVGGVDVVLLGTSLVVSDVDDAVVVVVSVVVLGTVYVPPGQVL